MLNSGAKFEEKPIFCFEIDKNLENFDPSTKKSKKYITFDLKKYRGVIFRSSRSDLFLIKSVLKICSKFSAYF